MSIEPFNRISCDKKFFNHIFVSKAKATTGRKPISQYGFKA